jgi:hypothetical protein
MDFDKRSRELEVEGFRVRTITFEHDGTYSVELGKGNRIVVGEGVDFEDAVNNAKLEFVSLNTRCPCCGKRY